MDNKISFFPSLCNQRYYHFISLKTNGNYSLNEYWRQIGFNFSDNLNKSISRDNFLIEQKRIISKKRYHFSELDLSIRIGDNDNFFYDLFAINLKNENIILLGFPFKNLAEAILNKLIEQKNLLKECSFIKPNITSILLDDNKKDLLEDDFTSKFIGVEFKYATEISYLVLNGDNPLESSIYTDLINRHLKTNTCQASGCIIKFETLVKDSDLIPKTRSNIHVDVFGNYKLYIHGSGNNIFTLPFLFKVFSSNESLSLTSINPIKHIKIDE